MSSNKFQYGDAGVDFNEERHQYSIGGRVISGVTSCISTIPDELRFNNNFIAKTILGTKVHELCEKVNKTGKRIHLNKIPKDLRGYMKGYYKFLNKAGFKILLAERRLFSRRYMFGGTADIIGIDCNGEYCIADIKTVTTMSPTVGLQLAGYMLAWNEWPKNTKLTTRWGIQLLPEGDYKLIQYTDPHDERVFLCKKVSYDWDKRNGMLNKGGNNGSNNSGGQSDRKGSDDASTEGRISLGSRPDYI